MDLLIWCGPVYASTPGQVSWKRPTTSLTFNQGPDGGIGSSSFGLLAEHFRDGAGHILPNLLASGGYSRSDFDKVAISGFSAAHGLMAPLLAADGDDIDAALALDACFSSYGALTKSGYVDFGARAARGEKFFAMTCSAGGGPSVGYSTGGECGHANFDAACDAAGRRGVPYTPPSALPVPDVGLRCGRLYLLDYGSQYAHGDHVNVLGVPFLNELLVPGMQGAALSGPLLFAGAAGVAFVAAQALGR